MRVLVANIEEVFREAAARWTLLAYFVLSTLVIITFAFAINLDVVDGALAGARLFGQDVNLGTSDVSIDKIVLGFESVFSAFLYIVGVFLAVFATAHLVPRLQEKGTVDLYLSRPIGRVPLLLSRYVAGLTLVASNLLYLILTIWGIVIWKTGVYNPRFLLGGVIIFFAISVLLAFAFLIGVVTSSTAVSIMSTYGIFFFSTVLSAHDKIEAAISSEWRAQLVHTLYWIFPKTAQLGQAVVAIVFGGTAPERLQQNLTPSVFISTALFGLVCLAAASWLFHRKEF